MVLPSFADQPLWVVLSAFAAAALVVWFAGTRLAEYLDAVSGKTGMGQAFTGMLLLGGITSLPEVATVGTASYAGNAPLAINNLLGSASINVVLLAVADVVLGRDALTSVVASPAPLLQGVLSILLLTVVAMAVATGDVDVIGLGVWSLALLPLFLAALALSARYRHRRPWVAEGRRERGETGGGRRPIPEATRRRREALAALSLPALAGRTLGCAAAILAAGTVLAQAGDGIAQQSGLGAGLVGLVLVGFATSLPEISSIVAALRLRQYEMVLGDIFGTNLFNVTLIVVADAFYAGGPVLNQAGTFEIVATLLAVVLTGVYIVGLLERDDRSVLRMGYDSLAVLVLYAAGIGALYALQSGGGAGAGA